MQTVAERPKPHISNTDSPAPTKKIVSRLKAKLNLTRECAEALWDDLEKFLELASEGRSVPPPIIDKAWHQFILYTREYAAYCQIKFGRFIHHVPGHGKQEDEFAALADSTIARAETRFGTLSNNWRQDSAAWHAKCQDCGSGGEDDSE
jgi:hypothetical protein